MHKIPVGILGASGYAGRELCGLVAAHPALSLAFATAHERRGETARVRTPAGAPVDVTFVAPDDAPLAEAALIFSALPHGTSVTWVARARAAGARVVDLSSDLRPGHLTPERLAELTGDHGAEAGGVPYGLPELNRDALRGAELVANPGCYPTAILVALAPLARAGLLPAGATIGVVAASGVTGAGFTARPDLLFGELTENFRAYGVGNGHRHLPEMRATLADCGADVDLVFTPQLLPVARGILATITVPLDRMPDDLPGVWRDAYDGERFVEVADAPPSLADVVRRNVVRLAAVPVQGTRAPMAVVVSAIDNLVKGAAGQALQNANLMLGLDEAAGLPL